MTCKAETEDFAALQASSERVCVAGKFFRLGKQKWHVRGFTYGPFPPTRDGTFFPDRYRARRDFAHMGRLGANAVRLYHPPPRWLLDEAIEHGIRVVIDVPWEKHRCFFEDRSAEDAARRRVRQTAENLAGHPAVFAISVVNEFPNDVVRFYGRSRLERFVDELIDVSKQEAPECLATFVNFPTTEFLTPSKCDFCCFNVYLHDPASLGAYLDRLQHIAGNLPLLLGEYGIDTIRHGEREQARLLSDHIAQVFRHGLTGSFVFSYTDEWFSGGREIDDWAFGVTTRDRSEKLAATSLRGVWDRVPHVSYMEWPKVSVVVCSYNGAETLQECLESLMRLDYPDYEVILVDDGSEDCTPAIAAQFPQVVYIRQPNRGLSVARNMGARAAKGDIIAYTDSDCVADEDWLAYLVAAMHDQRVDAIGGPNISPPSDGWIAQCVAASPGNPSHVMLDDRHAEHVPGCNMAFRRDKLLALGGFDPQFRQAGDDVDVCWRFLDAGMHIGYAPGAMVWHHRRSTIRAYVKQQKGYGRSEAMVYFKHPQRFSIFGRASWKGIIYGEGAVGLPLLPDVIYHGRFGSALFQTIYRHNRYEPWACATSMEWHAAALFSLALAALYWPMAFLSVLMWTASLAVAMRSAIQAMLPKHAPWWCRPIVCGLYFLQPAVRGWHRQTYLLRNKRLPSVMPSGASPLPVKRVSHTEWDLYWEDRNGIGRETLLEELVNEAKRVRWPGDFDNDWCEWDIRLIADRWHHLTIRTATEELGWPKRFTRARCAVRSTLFGKLVVGACCLWGAISLASGVTWAMLLALVASVVTLVLISISRNRCRRALTELVNRAGEQAGLTRYLCGDASETAQATARPEEACNTALGASLSVHDALTA